MDVVLKEGTIRTKYDPFGMSLLFRSDVGAKNISTLAEEEWVTRETFDRIMRDYGTPFYPVLVGAEKKEIAKGEYFWKEGTVLQNIGETTKIAQPCLFGKDVTNLYPVSFNLYPDLLTGKVKLGQIFIMNGNALLTEEQFKKQQEFKFSVKESDEFEKEVLNLKANLYKSLSDSASPLGFSSQVLYEKLLLFNPNITLYLEFNVFKTIKIFEVNCTAQYKGKEKIKKVFKLQYKSEDLSAKTFVPFFSFLLKGVMERERM